MVPMAPSRTRMRSARASWRAFRRAGRSVGAGSMASRVRKRKNPSAGRRVFGPVALAVFVERPQAEGQIGAIRIILPRPIRAGNFPAGGRLKSAPPAATWGFSRPRSQEPRRDRHRHPHRPRDPRLPGRGEAAAPPHDPLALLEPRDLPAGAGLQRLRRLRQAALRGARQPGPPRGRRRPQDPHRLRPRGAHAHRRRQRRRHEPGGGGREPRHHREVRHARVLLAAERRPAEGRRTSSASSAWGSIPRSSWPTRSP